MARRCKNNNNIGENNNNSNGENNDNKEDKKMTEIRAIPKEKQ
jgi:hypothetical protein